MKIRSKRVKAIVLIISMLISILGGSISIQEKAYAMTTQNEAVQWARSQVGSTYQRADGIQCVDLIREYYKYLGVEPLLGHAYTYTSNALPSGWERIAGATVQPEI